MKLARHRLYNLRDDIGETNELAASETAKFNELKALWDKWNATMAEPRQGQSQASPSPDRAPLILSTLDTDGDKKICEGEAQGALKQNFASIDRNGDGGIDLGELETVLKMAAGRNATSPSQAGDADAPGAQGDPSYGKRNPDAASFMNVSPDEMFYILNLVKIREKAKYEDGRETNLNGREADDLYDAAPEILKLGGGPVYAGTVSEQLAGSGPKWDRVAIVMYPSRAKLNKMSSSSAFQETAVHKWASLEKSQIMVTTPEAWAFSEKTPRAPSESSYPATVQDPSFALIHLVKDRDVAQYPAGSNEPKRSGREAMEIFEKSVEDEYTLELEDRIDATANPPTPGNAGQVSPGQSPGADQAPLILRSLDHDKDGKINQSEAVDGMKANFSLIDSNGDGGIDLAELEAALKSVAARGGR